MSPALDRPCCVRYALAPDALAAYAANLSLPDRNAALRALASAISSGLERQGILVFGEMVGGQPMLVVLAPGGDRIEARLRSQLEGVASACRRLRWVGYREAGEVGASLARRLRRRLAGRLGELQPVAIPRGGWLAAGLVARHLPAAVAAERPGDDAALLVIDDCAFSGVAFRRFAAAGAGRPIVFAPLFATAGLCRALERHQPEVEAVVAGEVLPDRGPELLGAGYADWRRRLAAVLVERPPWIGLTDFVCFPWNEPQRWVLDPLTGRLEPGWRILPVGRQGPRGAAAKAG